MKSTRWVSALFLAALAHAVAAAHAQDDKPASASLTVQAGVPQKVAFYPAAKKDCTRTPLPEIKLIDEPKLGKLIVRRASIKADPGSACPGQTIPGLLVLFVAKPSASGRDRTAYEVKAGERSATVRLDVQVIPNRRSPSTPIDI